MIMKFLEYKEILIMLVVVEGSVMMVRLSCLLCSFFRRCFVCFFMNWGFKFGYIFKSLFKSVGRIYGVIVGIMLMVRGLVNVLCVFCVWVRKVLVVFKVVLV